MNSKLLASAIIAAAGLVSVNSFAAVAEYDAGAVQQAYVSTKSRADVKAEYKQAAQNGTLVSIGNAESGVTAADLVPVGQRTREEVRAEAVQFAHVVNPLYLN